MIPIACKITIFPYTCLFTFLKISLINLRIPLHVQERMAGASRINYWKTHKPVHFVLSYVLSITGQYKQRTA